MAEYTEQSSVPQIENKRNQLSKKVWNIENTKLKEIESDGNSKLDYRLTKNIRNGQQFIVVDNKYSPAKRYILGKQGDIFYNLTTGEPWEF